MKSIAVNIGSLLIYALTCIILDGCKIPSGDAVSITTSGVGIMVGYNAASQMPELRLGFFRQTIHLIPTNASPVTSSLSLEQHGLTSSIFEEFTSGGATIPSNSVARLRAEKLK